MTDPQPEFARAGRREWIGLAVLAFPCFLLAMDFTVLHLAIPALTAELAPSSAQLLWIVDIYGFMIASSLITMGTLGDRIGRRKLLLIGGAMFGLASISAAFANSASMLIVTRAVLGVAGATLMPSTLALIRNMFHDEHQRRTAISIWINSFVIGGALGPLLGGITLEYFWWGAVFLLNVPVMLLLLALGPLLLPEFKDPNPGRLDLASVALSLSGMLSVIYGIKLIAQDGFGAVPAISIVAGVVIGSMFVMRQKKLTHPLIDLSLFAVPPFSAAVGTQLIAALSMGGIYLFVAQYLQLVIGLSPLHAGIALLPSTLSGIAATTLAPFLARRMPTTWIIAGGMALSSIGIAVLTQLGGASELPLIVASYVIISFGFSGAMTLTTDVIMSVAPPERAGAASGISETSAELGMALGIALLGSVGTAAYRSSMSSGLPHGIASTFYDEARATLAGAARVALELGDPLGPEVVASAREAFAHALALVSGISATLVIASAVITLVLLRQTMKPA